MIIGGFHANMVTGITDSVDNETTEGELPFILTRKQFPIRLYFAMVHLIAPVLWTVIRSLPDVSLNIEQQLNRDCYSGTHRTRHTMMLPPFIALVVTSLHYNCSTSQKF